VHAAEEEERAISPSSRRDGRRSQDQIEEAWWAKQLGRNPESAAAAAEHETERRVQTEPEAAPQVIAEEVHVEPAPEPAIDNEPLMTRPARRPPVWSDELARRALALLGPILLGVLVAWLVIMITK